MAATRNSKIQRYKEQKELEKKLHDLRDIVEQDTVDDEVKVGYTSLNSSYLVYEMLNSMIAPAEKDIRAQLFKAWLVSQAC